MQIIKLLFIPLSQIIDIFLLQIYWYYYGLAQVSTSGLTTIIVIQYNGKSP